eukprot:749681-Rhodomonas_salina.4
MPAAAGHDAQSMVIDEIGRPTEEDAARTCKQRGLRLVASARATCCASCSAIANSEAWWAGWNRSFSRTWRLQRSAKVEPRQRPETNSSR